jgi:hypothetical protein
MHATAMCRATGAAGEAPPRPYRGGAVCRRCCIGAARVGAPSPSGRGQVVPDPPAREGRPIRPRSIRCRDCVIGIGPVAAVRLAAPVARRARRRLAPTGVGRSSPVRHRPGTVGRYPPSCRGQALPDPPAREGRGMTPSPGYGCRSRRGWAPAVRPGLKPRAESASPLKGAVRRPGARVDRLGAGAVGISRLQPAWGVSPAVHGRAIEDTAARLVCAACRARRVGHAESPRQARRARQRLAPTRGGRYVAGAALVRHGLAHRPRPVGVRRCLTRRPGRAGNPGWGDGHGGGRTSDAVDACHQGSAASLARRVRHASPRPALPAREEYRVPTRGRASRRFWSSVHF